MYLERVSLLTITELFGINIFVASESNKAPRIIVPFNVPEAAEP